jgi:hypothetical protein
VHTNYFTHPGIEARKEIRDRYEQGIRSFSDGKVTSEKIVPMFSNHLGVPKSLYCHPEEYPNNVVIRDPSRMPISKLECNCRLRFVQSESKDYGCLQGPTMSGEIPDLFKSCVDMSQYIYIYIYFQAKVIVALVARRLILTARTSSYFLSLLESHLIRPLSSSPRIE